MIIWYNPDEDRYENGMKTDFVVSSSMSENQDRFEILYEFDFSDSSRIRAEKIVINLNKARMVDNMPKQMFA